ncbi:hypothetical protein SASPL_129752 [Salvia splendens]|uniref:Uncharacterized protein n=1 Tax=Salvia splendens TaxID=180675 RepID=A0A8X8XDW8_SALSN|nr:hypothetical protein SASPL_129752 [Salvia splendens]
MSLDTARSMIKWKDLPRAFWAEAIATATYLLNRCPTKSVRNMIPEEEIKDEAERIRKLKARRCTNYESVDESGEDNVNLICFYMDVDPVAYADAVQYGKWKIAI